MGRKAQNAGTSFPMLCFWITSHPRAEHDVVICPWGTRHIRGVGNLSAVRYGWLMALPSSFSL
jgi:hypothetical protein